MAWIIFAVALAVRLIHLWQIKPSPFFDVLLGDANGYDEWARRLAAGDWVGTEVFYQAPLYPYFIGVVYAVFGRDLLILRVIQAVIGSASCALLGLAGTRLFSRPAGLVAGLGLALYAPAIFFDGLLQKSVLDMFFVCLGLWLVSQVTSESATPATWIGLGLAMGGLALTRENALVFIVVIVAWIIVRARTGPGTSPVGTPGTLGTLGTFVLGLAVVLLPVAARNYAVGGGFYLTTSQFGSNLYIGNNPTADGTYASIRFGRGAPEFERIDATEVAEEAVGHALTPSEVSSFWTGRVIGYITSQPVDWVRLLGRKVLLLLNATEMLDTESQESYAEWSWPLAIGAWVGHFGVLVPLAVAGVFVTWPHRRYLWLLYAMTLAYGASVVVFYVFARYRYPLVPFLLLPAAAAFVGGHAFWREASVRMRGAAVAAVAASLVVTYVPLLSPTLMRSVTETNLGSALQAAGRHDQAVSHHQRAIALAPEHAPAYNNLGASLRAAGRLDEAIAAYRKALELKPDFSSASYNLANALLAKGDAGASVEQFREALAREPESVETRTNLAIALEQSGDTAGALAEFREALRLSPRTPRSHRNLGNALANAGDARGALDHLSQAVSLDAADAAARYDLGSLLLELQRFPDAAAQFEAALKVSPQSAEAMNNLGIALASQGRVADALGWFERALAARPGFADAQVNRDRARAALAPK